jgi:hypothetical protein
VFGKEGGGQERARAVEDNGNERKRDRHTRHRVLSEEKLCVRLSFIQDWFSHNTWREENRVLEYYIEFNVKTAA